MFSKVENELISTHGYSQNQIILWKVNGMKRIATLVGHSTRYSISLINLECCT